MLLRMLLSLAFHLGQAYNASEITIMYNTTAVCYFFPPCVALHCTALYYTARHYFALPCSEMPCHALHCPARQFPALHGPALHGRMPHFPPVLHVLQCSAVQRHYRAEHGKEVKSRVSQGCSVMHGMIV